jgi:hypothetical protein
MRFQDLPVPASNDDYSLMSVLEQARLLRLGRPSESFRRVERSCYRGRIAHWGTPGAELFQPVYFSAAILLQFEWSE